MGRERHAPLLGHTDQGGDLTLLHLIDPRVCVGGGSILQFNQRDRNNIIKYIILDIKTGRKGIFAHHESKVRNHWGSCLFLEQLCMFPLPTHARRPHDHTMQGLLSPNRLQYLLYTPREGDWRRVKLLTVTVTRIHFVWLVGCSTYHFPKTHLHTSKQKAYQLQTFLSLGSPLLPLPYLTLQSCQPINPPIHPLPSILASTFIKQSSP